MKVVIGPVIGEVAKDGKVIRKDRIMWCELCLKKRVKDFTKQTALNRQAFKKCEMKDYVVLEGLLEIRGKVCSLCHQTVEVWRGTI